MLQELVERLYELRDAFGFERGDDVVVVDTDSSELGAGLVSGPT
jgi:hypothetical protein